MWVYSNWGSLELGQRMLYSTGIPRNWNSWPKAAKVFMSRILCYAACNYTLLHIVFIASLFGEFCATFEVSPTLRRNCMAEWPLRFVQARGSFRAVPQHQRKRTSSINLKGEMDNLSSTLPKRKWFFNIHYNYYLKISANRQARRHARRFGFFLWPLVLGFPITAHRRPALPDNDFGLPFFPP